MTRFKLSSFRLGLCLGSFALLAALPGCRKDDTDESTGGDSSSSSTVGGSSTGVTVPTEGGTTATTDDTASGSGSGTEANPTTMQDTTVTTMGPVCDDPEDQPNNTICGDASSCGCESGFCFVVPGIGGFCGECKGDADCTAVTGGGCTVPNPIAQPPVGSTCNMGEAGQGCQSNEVCKDPAAPACGLLLTVPGIIDVSTCGACATNADCADPKTPNCSPTYDVMNFSGQYICVEDDSVAQDGGCNLSPGADDLPVGNAACASGFCGEAKVMGLVSVGICGECNSNADCVQMGKATCSDPIVDLESATLIGSVCT